MTVGSPMPAIPDRSILQRTSAHTLAINGVLILTFMALIRFDVDRLTDLHFPDLISFKAAISAGGLTLFTALVPAHQRKRLLVTLRSLLSSGFALWICVALLVASLLPCLISRIRFVWSGPASLSLSVNGRAVQLEAESIDGGNHRKSSMYALAGRSYRFSAGAFGKAFRIVPLEGYSITLPFYATSPQNDRLAAIEYQIISTFFDLFDRKDLADIRQALANTNPSNSVSAEALTRLTRIRDIVDSSANSSASISTQLALIGDFADEYSTDPWIELLKQQAHYGSAEYLVCSANTGLPATHFDAPIVMAISSAAGFLRGMCEMKAVVVQQRDPPTQREALIRARDDMVASSTGLQSINVPSELKDTARISTAIYEAICEFYSGDMEAALRSFKAVAEITSGSQQARSLNNAGFAAFVLADFAEAQQEYTRAYEVQPAYPYIRANLAYLMLAEGDNKSARDTFNNIANDVDLQRLSPEDVLLSRIMLLELDHDEGRPLSDVNAGYAAILKARGGPVWEFEEDPRTRYALLVHEVIDRIYLGGDYFGLEMFALTSAYDALNVVSGTPERSSNRGIAVAALENDVQLLRPRVSQKWLVGPHKGWFAHLNSASRFPTQAPGQSRS